ncbi:hypothetical protein DY000_02059578 [Brassica cretica]|uniref:AT-hook motif nuclear-localized protein n=1 Tax=Brassica cretica TaxID=69181 RepID=A0ABQ7AWY2_BRACR|nr:hypothetical protein DY000_02059578 [Brassica cretica]
MEKPASQQIQPEKSLALEGGGYISISLATTYAQSDMTTNAGKDPQTHDGTPVDANADKTPAGNGHCRRRDTRPDEGNVRLRSEKDGRTRKTRGLSCKTGGNVNGEDQEQSPTQNHKSPQR